MINANFLRRGLLLLLGLGGVLSFAAEDSSKPYLLPSKFRKLLPLHQKLAEPKSGDWLAHHKESGQTFRQYVSSHPVRATPSRRTLYVQPLGNFTPVKRKIVNKTAEFLRVYFGLPVKVREGLNSRVVPAHARRTSGRFRAEQWLTTYILREVLKPRLPKDAVALIAITDADLWPGEGWNYVFGQASLGDRVGVWSFHRFGDPERGDKEFRLCLLRTLKTATHETGHMFSMKHCIQLHCNMNGRNHLLETDRGPLEVCPYCLAKLCYATGVRPALRFEKLRDFCQANGFNEEAEFYEKSLAAFRKK